MEIIKHLLLHLEAGGQGRSQGVETDPVCNVQDAPQSAQGFSHLKVLSPEIQ